MLQRHSRPFRIYVHHTDDCLATEGPLPKDRHCTCNVTLNSVRVTKVAISITYLCVYARMRLWVCTCILCVCVCVCGWMRLRELARMYPYLPRMQGVAILSSAASLGAHFSTLYQDFRGGDLSMKCVFSFLIRILSKTFLILKTYQCDIDINVKTSLCKLPIILYFIKT